jgi:NDP-sugar pyrophosphorylase family protein
VKQLAPVGPRGEAILDVLLARATAVGFRAAVIVTSPTIEDEMRAHLATYPPLLQTEVVIQPAVPGREQPLGTAHAVLAGRDAIDGSFAVVNADDLYPPDAFAMLAGHLSREDEQALVAFRVGATLIGSRPVKRALLEFDRENDLVAIRESTVTAGSGGLRGDEWVSMNMWGFSQSMFDAIARAVDRFIATGAPGEILLPDVVATEVGERAKVRVLRCEQPCIGITYVEDVDVVRAALS